MKERKKRVYMSYVYASLNADNVIRPILVKLVALDPLKMPTSSSPPSSLNPHSKTSAAVPGLSNVNACIVYLSCFQFLRIPKHFIREQLRDSNILGNLHFIRS